jgi:hypothetical protein
MTQEQLEVRKDRAAKDIFVITTAEDGWRVRSARNPSKFYLVSENGAGLRCTCPDFEAHAAEDPAWQCKHVLAVQGQQTKAIEADFEAEERAAIQAESAFPVPPVIGESVPTQMLIKRSVSPDGRIDSVSVEFSSAVDDLAPAEIKGRALKTLRLQTEIVKNFLGKNPGTNGNPVKTYQPQTPKPNGATFARLLDVGVSNGQYGERFYLNVQVNGRRARFFGDTEEIARALSAAGEQIYPSAIEPGMRFNLPCLVLTKESPDGRYLNVTRVLPLRKRANGGAN